MIEIFVRLYRLAVPSGRLRLVGMLAMTATQALMQTLAVFSLLPFLSAAADMAQFRASPLGRRFIAVVGGDDRNVLLWAGTLSLALLLVGNGVTLIAELVRSRYAQSISHRLRMELITSLLARRYEYFLATNSAVLLKHLAEDVIQVAGGMLVPAMDLIARLLLTVLLVGIAVRLEPQIVLGGAVVVVAFYICVMLPIRARAERTSDFVREEVRELFLSIQQMFAGIKPILTSDSAPYFTGEVRSISLASTREMAKISLYSAFPRIALEVLVFGSLIGWVLVAVLSGESLTELVPRVGLIAIITYRLMPSVQAIFSHIGAMTAARQSLDEISRLESEQTRYASSEPGQLPAGRAEPLVWSQEIRFENVTFRYAGADEPTICDVSFVIAKGEKVAFVGSTGSGKTTLIDLLLGLHHPTSGRILIDGQPLDPALVPAWRRSLGYVPQDLFLLDKTIADNIVFGRAADDARVREVAELAQALEFIEDGRSGGFAERVGERGVRLSGGQRQRLALARALFGNPDTLLLDEATSALDPATERQVVAALAEAHDSLTVITVTHRINTVRNYDCIHYVENGRVVASGDFADLSERHADFRVQAN